MNEVTPNFKAKKKKRSIKGIKEECTRLHSKIVRQTKGPFCQACGERPVTDCAHIVGRVYSHTRTDENNAFALCGQCHRRFTNWSDEWMEFLARTIGLDEYLRLKQKAQNGVGVRFDWPAELVRLRAVWQRLERNVA